MATIEQLARASEMTRHLTLLFFVASCAPGSLASRQGTPDAPNARGAESANRATVLPTNTPGITEPEPRVRLELADRLTAGGIHNCFIDDFGKTLCWGNLLGKPRGVPLEIEGLSRATKVASGYDRACARTLIGTVECWGQDLEVDFRGLKDVKDVATGSTFECAIHEDATVSCWGALEPGSTKRYPPHKLDLRGAKAIAIGHYEGCVIDEFDRVLCFGHASAPSGSEDYPPTHFNHGAKRGGSWVVASAAALPGVTTNQSIRGGAGEVFAPCHARELATTPGLSGYAVLEIEWGKAGQRMAELEQLPHVTVMEQSFSGQIGERMRSCLVEHGRYFVTVPGIVRMRLDFFPLLSRALQPRHVLDGALSIDMFGYLGCAVTRDHELKCWQSSYAFGTKETDAEVLGGAAVERIVGVKNAVQVAVGLEHICVRYKDGSIGCVGAPEEGAAGPASDEFGFTRVKLQHKTQHLLAGALHTCAATDPPQVVCWGYGGRGGIGRGATENRGYDPAPVEALPLPAAW